MVAVDLGVAHVAGEHLEGPVPRDFLDFEDAGARPRRAGDEARPAANARRTAPGRSRRPWRQPGCRSSLAAALCPLVLH